MTCWHRYRDQQRAGGQLIAGALRKCHAADDGAAPCMLSKYHTLAPAIITSWYKTCAAQPRYTVDMTRAGYQGSMRRLVVCLLAACAACAVAEEAVIMKDVTLGFGEALERCREEVSEIYFIKSQGKRVVSPKWLPALTDIIDVRYVAGEKGW